jgi:ribosomal protein L11 methyltransferase
MRLSCEEASARKLTDLLGEAFDPAETAVAAFEIEEGPAWLLEAFFAYPPDEQAVRGLVRSIIGPAGDGAVFETVAQRDWVKTSLDGLRPVRAGRILVHGSHDRARVRANDLAIEIEAALAFGTGHHGTTQGCLLALVDAVKRRRPRRVLDIGTGTGILAFAAAKLLRHVVIAGDIDPVAVEVARDNARRNGVLPLVRFYHGAGIRHPLAAGRRRFDLVTANILARPLMRLAPAIAAILAQGGTVILSGLLERDVAGVLSAYAAQGLRLRRRSSLEGWATLVLARGGSAPRRVRA